MRGIAGTTDDLGSGDDHARTRALAVGGHRHIAGTRTPTDVDGDRPVAANLALRGWSLGPGTGAIGRAIGHGWTRAV